MFEKDTQTVILVDVSFLQQSTNKKKTHIYNEHFQTYGCIQHVCDCVASALGVKPSQYYSKAKPFPTGSIG